MPLADPLGAWKLGYIGVGMRPVLFVGESRPKRLGSSFGGLITKGESGGWLPTTSKSSSSISMSISASVSEK